ncbi:MAG: WbqC family protein [Bacteroidia bacterium]|nr:WbqC family protein [Bacteroidia bacterium]
MKKKIAAIQSNYIPWKGYFDIINSVDAFIIYDHVQYTKNDWRNRNKIKTHQGIKWITIPVSSRFGAKIHEVFCINNNWRKKHLNMIKYEYNKAGFYKEFIDFFEKLYLSSDETNLSKINFSFIASICQILDIKTKIVNSLDFNLVGDKIECLVELCKLFNANVYLSGPRGRGYLNEKLFKDENIDVIYMNYSGYKEYNQLFPPFDHFVSIIDLIFCEGKNAKKFMLSFNQ